MFARWAKMSKAFTRVGKEIAIAVKAGGPDPDNNPRLRAAMQNAKALNMPKDRVEAAISRATNKELKDYEEVVYEGYGPYGVAILIETATDNPTRTVANVRHVFNKYGGSLGKTGSLDFIFNRMTVFKVDAGTQNLEDLEFDLIDFGLEELVQEDGETIIYVPFADTHRMQKALEERNIPIISTDFERIPTSYATITEEQAEEVNKIVEILEEDDDVNAVFTNME